MADLSVKDVPCAAAAVAGTGMLAFTAGLAFSGCEGCARAASPLLVAAGGLGWWGAAALAALRRPVAAGGAGLFLLAGHLGLVLFAPVKPCVSCLVLLGAESIAAGLLASPFPLGKLPRVAAFAALAAAGLACGYPVSRIVWPVAPEQVLERKEDPSPGGGMTVYAVVPFNPAGCPEGLGLAAAVRQRKIDRAILVDGRSERGRRLRREHGLKGFPAFAALRGEATVAVQSGGTVESFLERLPR